MWQEHITNSIFKKNDSICYKGGLVAFLGHDMWITHKHLWSLIQSKMQPQLALLSRPMIQWTVLFHRQDLIHQRTTRLTVNQRQKTRWPDTNPIACRLSSSMGRNDSRYPYAILCLGHISDGGHSSRDCHREKKNSRCSTLLNTHFFVPPSLETLGPININGQCFLSDLGHSLMSSTRDNNRKACFLLQHLSDTIQIFNPVAFRDTLLSIVKETNYWR